MKSILNKMAYATPWCEHSHGVCYYMVYAISTFLYAEKKPLRFRYVINSWSLLLLKPIIKLINQLLDQLTVCSRNKFRVLFDRCVEVQKPYSLAVIEKIRASHVLQYFGLVQLALDDQKVPLMPLDSDSALSSNSPGTRCRLIPN